MGLFTKAQKSSAIDVYEEMKEYLHKKDGLFHVIMINSFSKVSNKSFGCEDKYTMQIDEIIKYMQKDGYEIIDIKFNSLVNQGIFKKLEGFHTLVTYI